MQRKVRGLIAPQEAENELVLWSPSKDRRASSTFAFGFVIITVALPLAELWTKFLGVGAYALIRGGIAAFVASIIGLLLINTIARYPGTERASAIVPSYVLAYGLVAILLLMLRLDYSRFLFAYSFIAFVLLSYFEHFRYKYDLVLRVWVLAAEGPIKLPQISSTKWLRHDPSEYARGQDGDVIAVDFSRPMTSKQSQMLANYALNGIQVYNLRHLVESLSGQVVVEHISETAHGSLAPPPLFQKIKSFVDRISALLALMILLPVLVVVALAIKVSSRGPVLFRQRRIGFQGKAFTVLKFRTMRLPPNGASQGIEALITMHDDARITKVGRFLRRTRIDELPQLANIVRGEMSWIGPRPEAEGLSNLYKSQIPYYSYRHIVRPGISGWAQTMQGHVADVDSVQAKLKYDFFYIKNFSLWLDLLIVAKTIRVVLSGFGAK